MLIKIKIRGELMFSLLFLILAFLIIISLILKIYLSYKDKEKLTKDYNSKINKCKIEIKEKDLKIAELQNDIKLKLKKARNIHQKILPDNLIEPADYLISDYYQPAEYIGGDYYNFFKIDHGAMDPFFEQYLLYFFDVSGHGIDSTLLSIFINESIENYFKLRHSPGEKISTSELMDYIDQSYQNGDFPDDYLVCLFIAVLDRKNNTLNYCSGGFQYPIYKLSEKDKLEEINIGGLPISTAIGALNGSRPENKFKFKKNSSLFLSTDGLLEQDNGLKAYYQRLEQILKKYKFLPAPFLNELIKTDFYKFTANKQAKDDITYLLLERPAAEIINYDLTKDKKEIEVIYKKIINFIVNKLSLEEKKLKSFKKIILEIFDFQDSLFKAKLLNNESFLMLSFEKKAAQKELADRLKKHSKLRLISDQKSDFLDFQTKNFSREEIYFCENVNSTKINFLVLK